MQDAAGETGRADGLGTLAEVVEGVRLELLKLFLSGVDTPAGDVDKRSERCSGRRTRTWTPSSSGAKDRAEDEAEDSPDDDFSARHSPLHRGGFNIFRWTFHQYPYRAFSTGGTGMNRSVPNTGILHVDRHVQRQVEGLPVRRIVDVQCR